MPLHNRFNVNNLLTRDPNLVRLEAGILIATGVKVGIALKSFELTYEVKDSSPLRFEIHLPGAGDISFTYSFPMQNYLQMRWDTLLIDLAKEVYLRSFFAHIPVDPRQGVDFSTMQCAWITIDDARFYAIVLPPKPPLRDQTEYLSHRTWIPAGAFDDPPGVSVEWIFLVPDPQKNTPYHVELTTTPFELGDDHHPLDWHDDESRRLRSLLRELEYIGLSDDQAGVTRWTQPGAAFMDDMTRLFPFAKARIDALWAWYPKTDEVIE